MSTRTTAISVIAFVLVIAGFSAYAPTGAPAPDGNSISASTTPVAAVASAAVPQESSKATELSATTTVAAPAPQATSIATATLIVAGTPLTIPASAGETVLDAMRALSSAGQLSFTSIDYPGLGAFVDSINGQKSAGGMNWMLYVNGVQSANGAASQAVEAGDVIEWKFEK